MKYDSQWSNIFLRDSVLSHICSYVEFSGSKGLIYCVGEMSKRYFEVVASGTAGVGKINIYGVLSDWYGDVNAVDFLAAFYALEATCTRINIHINSPGGSVWEGLPIANAIKASSVDVHTYVDGVAFSMAGIIAIAAPKGNVHMAKGSLLMLHSASTYGYGNAESLKKQAEDLSKYDDVLASFVESRTGKSLEDVKGAYFDGEDHFFTPSEAKADGLIDSVEDYDAKDTPENIENMSMAQVAAWYQGKDPKKVDNSENQNNMFNKLGKVSALAKVAAADLTADLLEAANANLQEQGVNGVTLVLDSELDAHDTNVNDLQTKVTALESKVTAKDARIAELEKEVKDLGAKPGAESGKPITDKIDNPGGEGNGEVEDFMTDYDREAQALFGK